MKKEPEKIDYKLTNKEIAFKGYNGNTLIMPKETKVYKDSSGKYTITIFGDMPFKKRDLASPQE